MIETEEESPPIDYRKLLISRLNEEASRLNRRYRELQQELMVVAHQRQALLELTEHMKVPPEEMYSEWMMLKRELTRNPADEDSRLLTKAKDFTVAEYGKGKFEGREAASFFRTIFGRISPDLEARFEALV